MERFTAMETFISVIETGSFSAGARRMTVGQRPFRRRSR
jgi:DNA-binding transcriptional LysR family regulator